MGLLNLSGSGFTFNLPTSSGTVYNAPTVDYSWLTPATQPVFETAPVVDLGIQPIETIVDPFADTTLDVAPITTESNLEAAALANPADPFAAINQIGVNIEQAAQTPEGAAQIEALQQNAYNIALDSYNQGTYDYNTQQSLVLQDAMADAERYKDDPVLGQIAQNALTSLQNDPEFMSLANQTVDQAVEQAGGFENFYNQKLATDVSTIEDIQSGTWDFNPADISNQTYQDYKGQISQINYMRAVADRQGIASNPIFNAALTAATGGAWGVAQGLFNTIDAAVNENWDDALKSGALTYVSSELIDAQSGLDAAKATGNQAAINTATQAVKDAQNLALLATGGQALAEGDLRSAALSGLQALGVTPEISNKITDLGITNETINKAVTSGITAAAAGQDAVAAIGASLIKSGVDWAKEEFAPATTTPASVEEKSIVNGSTLTQAEVDAAIKSGGEYSTLSPDEIQNLYDSGQIDYDTYASSMLGNERIQDMVFATTGEPLSAQDMTDFDVNNVYNKWLAGKMATETSVTAAPTTEAKTAAEAWTEGAGLLAQNPTAQDVNNAWSASNPPTTYDEWYNKVNSLGDVQYLTDANGNIVDGVYVKLEEDPITGGIKPTVVADPLLNNQISKGSALLLEEYVPSMQEKLLSGELKVGNTITFNEDKYFELERAASTTPYLDKLDEALFKPTVKPELASTAFETPESPLATPLEPIQIDTTFKPEAPEFKPEIPMPQFPNVPEVPKVTTPDSGGATGGGGMMQPTVPTPVEPTQLQQPQPVEPTQQQPTEPQQPVEPTQVDPTKSEEYKALESDLNKANTDKDSLETELEDTKSALADAKAEYDNLLDKSSDEAKGLQEEIDSLELGIEGVQSDLNAANATIKEKQDALDKATGTLEEQKTTITGLEESVAAEQEKVTTLEGELNVAKEDYAALQEQGKADVANAKAEGEKAVEAAKAEGEQNVKSAVAAGEKAVADAKAAGEQAVADAKAQGEADVKAAEAKGEAAVKAAQEAADKAVADAKAAGEQAVADAEAKAAEDAKAAQEASDKALADAKAAGQAAVDAAVAAGKAAAEAAYAEGYGVGETTGYGTGYGEGYGTGEAAGFGRGQGMMTTTQSFAPSEQKPYKGYMGGLSYRQLTPYQSQELIYQPQVVKSLFGDIIK